MNDKIDDGGSAFPETRFDNNIRQEVQWCGMTLLDYFAGLAMQSLVGDPENEMKVVNIEQTAMLAYSQAKAMIAERIRLRVVR